MVLLSWVRSVASPTLPTVESMTTVATRSHIFAARS
jgi:hypothetical protein